MTDEACRAAVEFAEFYDAYMARRFPRGLQPSYDAKMFDGLTAECWGRCQTFLALAGDRTARSHSQL